MVIRFISVETDAVCTILHQCDVNDACVCVCAGDLHTHTPPLGDGEGECRVEGNGGDTAGSKHPAKLVRLNMYKETT